METVLDQTRHSRSRSSKNSFGSPEANLCLLIKTAVLCEPATSKCTWTAEKIHCTPEFAGAKDGDAQFARACAVEMHTDMSQEPVYARIYASQAQDREHVARTSSCENLQEKRPGPRSGCTVCASLRSRQADSPQTPFHASI